MEEKSIVKHFFIIGGGTFIQLLLGLITTPLITRLVDPVEYGQLSIFTMYSNMLALFLLLGMDQAVVRYYYEVDSLDYKRALLFSGIKLPTIAVLITGIVIITLSAFHIVSFEFNTVIMVWLCLYTIIQIYSKFSQNMLRLAYKSKTYSSVNIIQKVSYVIIAVPILLLTKENFLMPLIIATVMSLVISLSISIYVQRDIWNIRENDPTACTISLRELTRYSFPLILSTGITTLFQVADKLSLNIYCSYTEVGIYSSTMSLVNIFAILQTAFKTIWFPMAVEHYTKDKEDRLFYQNGNSVITVVMFLAGLSLILCKDIFAILLGEEYREAAYILPFLIFHPIMYSISETTVTGIAFMKKTKMHIVIAGISCAFNVIGNMILVPKLGCQGAAISTGLAYIVFFTMRTVISNHYFYIDFKLVKFYILTAAACAYAFYNTFVSFSIWSIVGYILCVALLIVLYWNTVKWCIKYVTKFAVKVLKKV